MNAFGWGQPACPEYRLRIIIMLGCNGHSELGIFHGSDDRDRSVWCGKWGLIDRSFEDDVRVGEKRRGRTGIRYIQSGVHWVEFDAIWFNYRNYLSSICVLVHLKNGPVWSFMGNKSQKQKKTAVYFNLKMVRAVVADAISRYARARPRDDEEREMENDRKKVFLTTVFSSWRTETVWCWPWTTRDSEITGAERSCIYYTFSWSVRWIGAIRLFSLTQFIFLFSGHIIWCDCGERDHRVAFLIVEFSMEAMVQRRPVF